MFLYQSFTKKCSESEYEHTKIVWADFSIRNLKEYTKLYNHCDVSLLKEEFFFYRKVIIQSSVRSISFLWNPIFIIQHNAYIF